jgi:hypothetical protein
MPKCRKNVLVKLHSRFPAYDQDSPSAFDEYQMKQL